MMRAAPHVVTKGICRLQLQAGGDRVEQASCEELHYHLLFRWFLDMDMVEPSFDRSTFSKNRQRLLQHRVSREFFDGGAASGSLALLSDEHFSVDGTRIEATASLKSFRPKAEPPPPPKRPEHIVGSTSTTRNARMGGSSLRGVRRRFVAVPPPTCVPPPVGVLPRAGAPRPA
jgi:hypothetical protein